jgi:hypothetical protein
VEENKNMLKNEIMSKVGMFSFITGIIIAGLLGIVEAWMKLDGTPGTTLFNSDISGIIAWILVLLGVIIGLLTVLGEGTITKKETPGFLIAGMALLVMYAVFKDLPANLSGIKEILESLSFTLTIFVGPIVTFLALKAVWDLGKDV